MAEGAFADLGDEAEAEAAEDELYMGFAKGIVESNKEMKKGARELNQHATLCTRLVTRLFGVLGAFCAEEKHSFPFSLLSFLSFISSFPSFNCFHNSNVIYYSWHDMGKVLVEMLYKGTLAAKANPSRDASSSCAEGREGSERLETSDMEPQSKVLIGTFSSITPSARYQMRS